MSSPTRPFDRQGAASSLARSDSESIGLRGGGGSSFFAAGGGCVGLRGRKSAPALTSSGSEAMALRGGGTGESSAFACWDLAAIISFQRSAADDCCLRGADGGGG